MNPMEGEEETPNHPCQPEEARHGETRQPWFNRPTAFGSALAVYQANTVCQQEWR
jgi:hypothetical protein